LQQYQLATDDVVIDTGAPSGKKVPAAPAVEISVAKTLGPVALW